MEWHTLETSEVCAHFAADPARGLDSAEAARRLGRLLESYSLKVQESLLTGELKRLRSVLEAVKCAARSMREQSDDRRPEGV